MGLLKSPVHFILVLSLSVPSYAGRNEEAILEAVAKSGAEAYVRDQVQGHVERWVNQHAADNSEMLPPDFGGTLVAYINLGLSVDRYNDTENGDFKTLEGANVGANVIAIINPAVGAMVKGALFAVGAFLSAMTMEYQKEKFRILGDTFDEYKKIIAMNREQARAESIMVSKVLELSTFSIHKATEHKEFLSRRCQAISRLETPRQLYRCLMAVEGFVLYKKMYIEQMERLLFSMNLTYIPLEKTLQSMGFSPDKIQQQIIDYKESLSEVEARVGERTEALLQRYLEDQYSRSLSEAQDDFEEVFVSKCERKLSALVKEMTVSLSSASPSRSAHGEKGLEVFLEKATQRSMKLCVSNLSDTTDQVTVRYLALLEKNIRRVRDVLGGEEKGATQ